ncbi:hypothetical protein [Streptomyces clavifer]|uniref:hypothetical protein n=1 Tax=Streptomyces clavifer TaxID=68188 RepID=UPI003659C9D6
MIDYSNPQSLDWSRVQTAMDAAVHPDTRLLVVEGTFALLPALRSLARWGICVDAPADLRLARKTLRKIGEGADPEISLRGYLAHGRTGHTQHVVPIQSKADLTLDGSCTTDDLVREVVNALSSVLDLSLPATASGLCSPAGEQPHSRT